LNFWVEEQTMKKRNFRKIEKGKFPKILPSGKFWELFGFSFWIDSNTFSFTI